MTSLAALQFSHSTGMEKGRSRLQGWVTGTRGSQLDVAVVWNCCLIQAMIVPKNNSTRALFPSVSWERVSEGMEVDGGRHRSRELSFVEGPKEGAGEGGWLL